MSVSTTPYESRLHLFPISVRVEGKGVDTEITIGGFSLNQLADQYGTPLYLYDQATLDANLDAYRQSLSHHYPGSSGITYAGKAFLCLAMAQWVKQQGISLDCSSAGELFISSQVGLPRQQIVSHGVNKSLADHQAAIQHAGIVVVDNLTELERIIDIHRYASVDPSICFPHIWLRLKPGTIVQTHSHIQTGQVDSKFGLDPQGFIRAVKLCQIHGIPVSGLHFHLGSHLHTPEPVVSAIEVALDVIQECYNQTGWLPTVICPGGGWGVPYHVADLPHQPIDDLVVAIAKTLISCCQALHLPLFHLQLEPGRSLVARAGVAIYRIGATKFTPNRRYLLLDGGLADNPRPALYQAQYSALPVNNPLQQPSSPAWLAGPYCESGDILIENLPLPELKPGELIAIPASGAYQLSMSSNYNCACRPAVLWVHNQHVHLIQQRETASELIRRDLPLPTSEH